MSGKTVTLPKDAKQILAPVHARPRPSASTIADLMTGPVALQFQQHLDPASGPDAGRASVSIQKS